MVLTFGRLIADGATNIIPNVVELSGTLRTVDEEWRSEAKNHIKRTGKTTKRKAEETPKTATKTATKRADEIPKNGQKTA